MNLSLLLYCSARCAAGPKHPPPSKATKCLDQGSLGQGEQIQQFRLSHAELRASGGALGGLDLVAVGSVTILPPPSVPVGHAALLSALVSLAAFRRSLSLNQHALPAHYKAPSGLQNPSMPELVSVSFLFLSFPNVLPCVQLLKKLAKYTTKQQYFTGFKLPFWSWSARPFLFPLSRSTRSLQLFSRVSGVLGAGHLAVPSDYRRADKASDGAAGSLGSYMLSGY